MINYKRDFSLKILLLKASCKEDINLFKKLFNNNIEGWPLKEEKNKICIIFWKKNIMIRVITNNIVKFK